MSEIQPELVNVLNNFTKDNFDVENTRSTAIELKQRGETKQILIEQLESNEQNDKVQDENGRKSSELKFTNLRVTMPDGTVIHHQASNETYIEVLERLGLEEGNACPSKHCSKEAVPA